MSYQLFFWWGIFFWLGAIVGSFLNALIHRLPRGINIVFPRSACPQCHTLIPFYHNIPIISFLVLRAKCSHCQQKIAWRYFFVELVMALGLAFLAPFPGGSVEQWWLFGLKGLVLACFLVHFWVDVDFQILPDSISIVLALAFLVFSNIYFTWQFWLSGLAIGFFFPLAVMLGFYYLRGQIGLGFGDIKLYGILGIYLGPQLILQNIFLSCLVGACFGGILIALGKMNKNQPIAFGPFILLVASVQIYLPGLLSPLKVISW